MNAHDVRSRLELACRFLQAQQVRAEDEVGPGHRQRHPMTRFAGSIWGQWRVGEPERQFFCPLWHAGQAARAWIMAAGHLGPAWLEPARRAADFILANQVADGPDRGLLLGYEDFPHLINTSAQLEAVEGLFALADADAQPRYAHAAVDALRWVGRHAYIPDLGLVRDLYDPARRCFAQERHFGVGRPLLDGGVWLLGHAVDPQAGFLDIACRIADRLLADEEPAGNWVRYQPAIRHTGSLHPRHAYWWGRPMLELFDVTGDARYYLCFLRAVDWYRKALRSDGGIFRDTRIDFRTASFGQTASASACAAMMFLAAAQQTDEPDLPQLAQRALGFALGMQFTRAADAGLNGAVIEQLLPPDGSERSPYFLRDTATIFAIQAMASWLSWNEGRDSR